MPTNTLALFEEIAGYEVKDLFTGTEASQDRARKRLANLNLAEVARGLAALEKLSTAPAYPGDELVLRLYDAADNYGARAVIGPRPPMHKPGTDHIWSALLYGHRVEMAEPLGPAVRLAVERRYHWHDILISTLHVLYKLRPLIDQEIVTLVPPGTADVDLLDLLDRACGNRDFRRTLLSALPELHEYRAPWALPRRRRPDLVGKEGESPRLEAKRIGALREIMDHDMVIVGPLSDIASDLQRLLDGWARSNADLWFPSMKHLDIFLALASVPGIGLPAALVERIPVRIADLHIADFGDLTLKDLIRVRLSSDVFDAWREAVRESFAAMDRKIALNADPQTARNDAAAALDEYAKVLVDRLRRDQRNLWTGALRGFAIGAAGSVPGSVVDGKAHVAFTAIGGATGFMAGLAWDRAATADQHKAMRTVPRHVAALGAAIRRG
jgi:hypothetical protein